MEIDSAGFAYWKTINRADKVIPLIRTAPWTTFNFHAPTLFRARDDAVMRDYAKRFGRQSYLVTALATSETPVFEWVSLYRPDPNDQFSEAERAYCQSLMGHLTEALRVNLLLQDRVPAVSTEGTKEFTALVDAEGLVLAAQAGFQKACLVQWREFDGVRLPASLMRHLLAAGAGTFAGGRVTIRARQLAEYFLLSATSTMANSTLSPRQLEVSMLFAGGHQAKEIARTFGVSTSTVRNQLIASYRALGVSNRKGLQDALAKDSRSHLNPHA